MKAPFLSLAICAIFLMATGSIQGQDNMEVKNLKHVVLIKFKDAESSANIDAACEAFERLKAEIALIKSFEWGENNSPEGLNQGLTHCFIATFHSEEDRDAYLIHPAHKAFVKEQGPKFDKVTVVDYWVK